MRQAGTDPQVETAATKTKNGKGNVRNTFPKVYRQYDRRAEKPYWVVDKGYVITNPTDGISFRPERFEKEFYPPETTKRSCSG